MPWREPITGGDDVLQIDKIQSVGFVSGTSGWIIERQGNAEFNDLLARGSIRVGPDGQPQVIIDTSANQGYISFPTHQITEDPAENPAKLAAIQAYFQSAGTNGERIGMSLHGAESESVTALHHKARILLLSETKGGGTPAQLIFQIIDNLNNNVNDNNQPQSPVIISRAGTDIDNYRRPMFKFSSVTPQVGLARNANNKVLLDTTLWDTETGVALDTVNNRFNIGWKLGWWRITYNVTMDTFSGVNVSDAESWFSVNGTAPKYGRDANPIAVNAQKSSNCGTDLVEASSFTDYVELFTRYTSGTAGAAYNVPTANVYPSITFEYCRSTA